MLYNIDINASDSEEVKSNKLDELAKRSHIGNINPIRYRGYYYDVESNLYYLNTRYYDPQIGRFINADEITILDETQSQIHGLNLYMYCGNNPIMMADPSGRFFISLFALVCIGVGVGTVVGAGVSVVSQGIEKGWSNINVGQVVLDAIIGGIGGGLAMSGLGAGALAGIGAGLAFVGSVGGHLINGSDMSAGSTWIDIGISTGIGLITGAIGGKGINAKYQTGRIATMEFNKLTVKSAARRVQYNSTISDAKEIIIKGLARLLLANSFYSGVHVGYKYLN